MLKKNGPVEVVEEVAITGGDDKRHRAFPALAKTQNGDLLVAYREGSDHHRTDNGVIMLTRSSDGGYSWKQQRSVSAEPGWNCYTSHGMGRLADGTLLLSVVRGRHLQKENDEMRSYARGAFSRSTDSGYLWDETGAKFDFPTVNEFGHCFAYGSVHERSDGSLMVPFSAVPRGIVDYKLRVTGVVFSEDKFITWSDYRFIYEDTEGSICPSETELIRLEDGRYLAMIRSNTTRLLYRSYSEDEGKSWGEIVPTKLPGQSPAMIYLASGQIFCAYRDMDPRTPAMSCAVSNDSGKTWEVLGYLYTGTNWDCAYPSMVHLSDNRIYCAYYTSAEPEAITGSCEIRGIILKDHTSG